MIPLSIRNIGCWARLFWKNWQFSLSFWSGRKIYYYFFIISKLLADSNVYFGISQSSKQLQKVPKPKWGFGRTAIPLAVWHWQLATQRLASDVA
jgi:hypothetical protein